MRSKVFIAVLVALAMLLSFGVAVKNAQADAILFPWIVKSNTVSTLVSVVNTAGDRIFVSGLVMDYRLHYQYWYKETNANGQTEKCEPVSFKRPTSKDDIVSFDASCNINDGKALFNDPSPYGDVSFCLSAGPPRRAFLLVDNNTPAMVDAAVNVDGTLYGEAIVLELAGGAGWGYIAYNADGGETSTQTSPVDFSDGLDVQGEVIAGSDTATPLAPTELTQTVLLPPDVILTRLFVTPVDVDVDGDGVDVANQRIGNANARVQLVYMDEVGALNGGIYDNDENPIDFVKRKNIVCTSADNLESFFTESGWDAFLATGGQGWSYVVTIDGTIDVNPFDLVADNPTNNVIIGKLEFTTSGVTIDGTTIPGTLNNFVWLRDNASILGEIGINAIHNQIP